MAVRMVAAQIAFHRQRFRIIEPPASPCRRAERQAAGGVDFRRQRRVKPDRRRRSGWSAQ
jgi:hypothetical protein